MISNTKGCWQLLKKSFMENFTIWALACWTTERNENITLELYI